MKLILTKQQRKVALAAATDDSRPALTCIAVGHGRVVAAEGFMAVTMPHPYQGDDVQIPASFVARFKRCEDVTFTVGPKRIAASDGKMLLSIERPNIGATFPNLDRIIEPLHEKPVLARVALNNRLLRRAMDALDGCDCGITRIYLREIQVGVDKATEVEITAQAGWCDETGEPNTVTALIMPMFVAWSEVK